MIRRDTGFAGRRLRTNSRARFGRLRDGYFVERSPSLCNSNRRGVCENVPVNRAGGGSPALRTGSQPGILIHHHKGRAFRARTSFREDHGRLRCPFDARSCLSHEIDRFLPGPSVTTGRSTPGNPPDQVNVRPMRPRTPVRPAAERSRCLPIGCGRGVGMLMAAKLTGHSARRREFIITRCGLRTEPARARRADRHPDRLDDPRQSASSLCQPPHRDL